MIHSKRNFWKDLGLLIMKTSFLCNFSNREEGSIIKSMGGANPDSTNGIKNRVLFN
jgi:hypothetical protein